MDTDKKIPLGVLLKERLLKDFDKERASSALTSAILSMADKDRDWIVVEGENLGVANFVENFIETEELKAFKISGDFGRHSNSYYISLTGHLPIITAGIPKADIFVKADGIVVRREQNIVSGEK